MDDIIDYCGYDAKHSFEDTHTPIRRAKRHWGERIALLGGVDMDLLARRSSSQVRDYVRDLLSDVAASGFALGSGNTVANYVPVENYLAMLDEGRKYRAG
jgi:uroporphyrinogen decarboxylase